MASNNDECKMHQESEETPLLNSKKVKRQILDVFREMTDKISKANFEEIFTLLKDADVAITNEEQIVQQFKETLYRTIFDNFSDMWHCQEIDNRLTILRFCKEKCKNHTNTWRPTGKTPEEQTRFLRIHHLKKKIAFIEDILKCQQENLGITFEEVEQKRNLLEELSTRREDISNQVDLRMTQLVEKDNEYQRFLKDLS